MDLNDVIRPARIWSREEVLSKPSPVPRESGLYVWYFRAVPSGVPVDDCVDINGCRLLYSGISPKAPPKSGGKLSQQTLWNRIRYHFSGNAEGSTLRLTLGCLLSEQLGIELRRVGSGRRMTFHEGEQELSLWMSENAFVAWVLHPQPWVIETEI